MSEMPPEQNLHECAVLLAAADHTLCDDMTAEKAVEFARRSWHVMETDPLWANGRHDGDCTKHAHSCARCYCEDYEREARERWDS